MIGDSNLDILFTKNLDCGLKHISYFIQKVI